MARITVVCTGNINRSPFAAALLKRALPQHEITSAGLIGEGIRTPERMVRAAATYEIDLTTHVSTRLQPADVEGSALVLAMDKTHPVQIAAVSEAATANCFTIEEAIARLAATGAADSLEAQVAIAADRPVAEFLAPRFREITDPMGRSRRAHAKVTAHLAESVQRLTAVMAL